MALLSRQSNFNNPSCMSGDTTSPMNRRWSTISIATDAAWNCRSRNSRKGNGRQPLQRSLISRCLQHVHRPQQGQQTRQESWQNCCRKFAPQAPTCRALLPDVVLTHGVSCPSLVLRLSCTPYSLFDGENSCASASPTR